MRRLNTRVEIILDDLRSDLETGAETTEEDWPDIVEGAMQTAWDDLLAAEPTGEVE